jgi:protein SCO1/2
MKFLIALTVALSTPLISYAAPVSKVLPPPKQADATLEILKKAGITEKLGSKLDLNLQFRDESGTVLPLSTYFKPGRPVLLVFAYYNCPHLCTLVLNGMLDGMKALPWSAGKEFEVVTLSIDPKEGPDLAWQKKDTYLKGYNRMGAENGWHFLTGDEANIRALANQAGFGYEFDPKSKDYAHSAGIFAVTPGGVLSRILYGTTFRGRDLKLAVQEAGEGKIGNIVERVLFYCYEYDAHSRGYAVYAMRLVQVGMGMTVIMIAGWIFLMGRKRSPNKGAEQA